MKLVKPVPQTDAAGRRRTASLANTGAAAVIWAYFNSNPDRVVLKVAFLKVRVRDLRVLFEAIAGPEPT